MICAGIDAGSRSIKAVLFDTEQDRVLSTAIRDQGIDQQGLAQEVFQRALDSAGLDRARVGAVAATGYGRNAIRFADTTITEITCHARGVHHLEPGARTIIEIGGQDSKVISLEDGGRVRDFSMNDRCAAGTGRFLEVVASRLGVDLSSLGELSKDSRQPAIISNMCVVFAETEIIGLLAEGVAACDIVAGVQNSIGTRVATLAGRSIVPPVCFTGGVALLSGMVRAMEETLACPVRVMPRPQFTGALGAAILAGRPRQAAAGL
jgi:predicted CoA-substrate-specific enzyme activase